METNCDIGIKAVLMEKDCEANLLTLGNLIPKILASAGYHKLGDLTEFENEYYKYHRLIDECINKINEKCSLNLKHMNFWGTDDFILAGKTSDDIVRYLDETYGPLEKKVKLLLSGADDSYWRIIHPEIINVSKNKFDDGHYADAVESAFKEVNSQIKTIYKNKTGIEDDGVSLMQKAFSYKANRPDLPCIQVDNDLSSQNGLNRQTGYRFIFAGSIQAIRNPKAHNNLNISKEAAMHSICLASQLMHTLDNSKINY
jgi:uncharacterized protein (TIGR02391 family)